MRVLQFAPGRYRGLPASPLYFTLDPDASPDIQCSIRFLVGQNGAGKSNVLRFLASIFQALDEGYRRPHADSPAYNIRFGLAYQLRGDTIIVRSDGKGRSGVEFTINGEARAKGDIPDKDRVLPRMLLVYTSGNLEDWRTLFADNPVDDEDEGRDEIDLTELRRDEELPPGSSRTVIAEDRATGVQVPLQVPLFTEGDTAALSVRRSILVEPQHMRLALLAALLDYQARQSAGQPLNAAFGDVLKQVNIKLIGFSLRIDPTSLPVSPTQRRQLGELYDIATLPLQEWETQLWVYDLDDNDVEDGKSVLMRLHEGPVRDPFPFFQLLTDLQRASTLRDVNLILQYTPADGHDIAPRTLLAESLSDGEFAFVARLALIYLLNEKDCLFLLDEPETHFNDDWKRNLVDNIERALTDTNSEVILTSHASITLTDAYPDEVILLTARGQDAVPLTLAAEPGEVLMRLFGADKSVGKRAQRRIEAALEEGNEQTLHNLLDEVGVGYYRFRIVEKLEELAKRVPPAE